jgi:hypothetical protein
MKITKQVLKKMIKEELKKTSLKERAVDEGALIQDLVAQGYKDKQEVDRATCEKINKAFQAATGDPLAGPCTLTDAGGMLELQVVDDEKSVADGDKIDTLRDANKALKRAFERINTRPEIIRTLVDVLMDMENAAEKDTVAALKLVLRDLLKT